MVANRKTPAAPAPTGSRTSSSQVLSKFKNHQPPPSSKPLPPSDADKETAAKAKHAKKQKRSTKSVPPRSSPSWSQRIFLFLLGFFSVYAFSICPADYPRTSRVCHSLDLYRTYILDPYLVPPIQALLQRAEPHIAPLKPYVVPAAKYTRTHIAPRAANAASWVTHQVRTRVVPAYQEHIYTNIWMLRVKPFYSIHVHPMVYPYIHPYILYYHSHVLPAIQLSSARATNAYDQARPYAVHAFQHVKVAYDVGKKHACTAYTLTKPHVEAAYVRARPHAIALGEALRVHASKLFRRAVSARKIYVDPHIRRIWDKVAEKRPSAVEVTHKDDHPAVLTTTGLSTASTSSSPPSVERTSVVPQVYVEHTVTIERTLTVTHHEPAPSAPPPPASLSSSQNTISSFISVVPESDATPIPLTEHQVEMAASVVAESLHPTATQTARAINNGVAASGATTLPEDVDGFLRDLGISADGNEVQEGPVEVDEPASEEMKEEEQPEENAPVEPHFKREDIVGRHEKWERELRELVESAEVEVRKTLNDIREEATKELASYGADRGKVGVVGVVEEEAGRFIKGLEGYFKGAEKRVELLRGESTEEAMTVVEKEQKTWWKVVEKTEEKFAEKVNEVQVEVHGWYVKLREHEGQEVWKIAEKVKVFAENAQADLGLEYAWLSDVTYADWQRYHDLVRVADNFTILARALQSGDHSAPASHRARTMPLDDALLLSVTAIERDVADVTQGFQAKVAEIRRQAGRTFDAAIEQARVGQAETISILPVDPTAVPGLKEHVEQAFLGRSKEEVEGKLSMAGAEVVSAREVDEL